METNLQILRKIRNSIMTQAMYVEKMIETNHIYAMKDENVKSSAIADHVLM